MLALGKQIPPNLELALEFGVGLMLIALGADVLRRLFRNRVHFHVHRHGADVEHVHAHGHAPAEALGGGATARREHAEARHEHAHGLPLRALAVGTMHGLAGSAALVLLSLGAVQSWQMGLLHIAVFGFGSIAGMAILSVAIAVPLRLSSHHLGRLHHATAGAFGAFSCVVGIALVIEIGFVRGLLAG